VVPLRLYEPGGQAKGQVVLPQVFAHVQKEEIRSKASFIESEQKSVY
jgi:hypothetical protein